MSDLMKVGITQGDPNGIGYEIIVKALAHEAVTDLFTPVVFGYSVFIDRAVELSGLEDFKYKVIGSPSEIIEGVVNVIEPKGEIPKLEPGVNSNDAGKSAVESLKMATQAVMEGHIDAIVTAPISKESVQSSDFNFPGHTEFLEAVSGEPYKARMILFDDQLRVALLSTHLPLAKVAESVTQENIIEAVKSLNESLKKDFSCDRPIIAVLSLNPHSGDGGVLGTEEQEIIIPALQTLRQEGILAFGPFPADGFFGHGDYNRYDGVLAMYHDQGLAPFKTLATAGGVNFTAGLPFVRTSPDHGTAFDIAWKGQADATSMSSAIYAAIDIFRRRRNFEEASANPLKKFVHERPERPDRFDKSNRHKEETDILNHPEIDTLED